MGKRGKASTIERKEIKTLRSNSLKSRYAALSSEVTFLKILQLEQDVETVVKVLQPGPLGIVEHKFNDEEIKRANLTVHRAVENWRKSAYMEQKSPFLKNFIDSTI